MILGECRCEATEFSASWTQNDHAISRTGIVTTVRSPGLVILLLAALWFALPIHTIAANQQKGSTAAVDLNSASEKVLESLPGVGPATAKKIIAGRPYSSIDDLSKAGVSAGTIQKLAPFATIGGGGLASTNGKSNSEAATSRSARPTQTTGTPVDLNSASAAELKELPHVGDATAKKIIAGRPYSSVNDLSKAGIPKATIDKIAPLITVNGVPGNQIAPAPAEPKSLADTSSPKPAAQPARQAVSSSQGVQGAASAPASQAAANGMVWVNTDSGVYHKAGSRYYGTTKNGKYMSEADAEKAGYRAAKNEKE